VLSFDSRLGSRLAQALLTFEDQKGNSSSQDRYHDPAVFVSSEEISQERYMILSY
jgi:hypothetical protein